MKHALIIFVRNPELGKVKTRLAATIGNEKALLIYKELLQHTFNISSETNAAKFIFYFNEPEENDIWDAEGFTKKVQSPGNLGYKMKDAFTHLFNDGYEKIVIIGSDCFELTTIIIEEAFTLLEKNVAVIGPANDGGYYLLGLKKMLPYIFENKQWSTQHVYDETINDLTKNNISFHALINLTDVDTEEDWLKTKEIF